MANKPFKGIKSSLLENDFTNSPESVAGWFDTAEPYAVGDIVYHGLNLYRFNTAHPAGEWTGTDVDEITVGEALTQLKADLTAIETDIESGNLTAGTAKQLLADTGMTDKSPYLFRAMPTGAGDRERVDAIVGGSVVWNQQFDFVQGSSKWAYNGAVDTSWSNGAVTYSNPLTAASYAYQNYDYIPGHKYLYYVDGYGTLGEGGTHMPSFIIYFGDSAHASSEIRFTSERAVYTKIISSQNDANTLKRFTLRTNEFSNTLTIYSCMIFDLTQMFGSTIADHAYSLEQATAGAGIAWLKKYGFFTKDYYPYCEPTFKHVEGLVSHKMTGFNQWDEVWELGAYNTSTGEKTQSGTTIRNKNIIPIVDTQDYYFKLTGASSVYVTSYDANGNYLGLARKRVGNSTNVANSVFYVPSGTAYIGFYSSNYGTTYNHDICINLSNPAKNGTYEPYTAHTYPLGSDVVLRGYPKLDASNNLYFDGDVYKPDGTVSRRYSVVDLGTLNWTNNGENKVAASIANKKIGSQNIIADNFTRVPATTDTGNMTDGQIKAYATSQDITLYLTGITAANASTMLSGKYLLYELDTPTTETADPYAPLQLADPYGTEEWVLADGAFPMPVGQETFYPENLRAKIEGLPWNFANLIAPTEVSNVATRNYTAGNLLIVDNVLYKVTVNIANGGTITPGTNVTATTLAEIISALQ